MYRFLRLCAAVVVSTCAWGCSDGGPEAVVDSESPLEALSDPVSLATGGEGENAWEVVAQDSSGGLCLEVLSPDKTSTVGCGFEVPVRHEIGYFTHEGPGDQLVIAGAVVKEAVAIRFEFERSAPVEVRPLGQAAGFATHFYVGAVEAPAPLTAVTALGEDDAVLERRSTRP